MIDGIVMDVTGQELIDRIEAREADHRERARECQAELQRLSAEAGTSDRVEGGGWMRPTPERLERKSRQYLERAEALLFLRNHVVVNETYRLTQTNLRTADLLPDRLALGDVV